MMTRKFNQSEVKIITAVKHLPIVDMYVELKLSSANRMIKHVLPTPLSPISNSLKRKSYFFAIVCFERLLTLKFKKPSVSILTHKHRQAL